MAVLLGIDEAGRGSVLGPLVVAGYAVEEADYDKLAALPLADSKAMQPAARSRAARLLRGFGGRIVLRVVAPAGIDRAVERGGLNALEIGEMTAIIKLVRAAVVYVDALTSKPARFGRHLEALAGEARPKVVAENKADTKYPLVQAASILAKVARDSALARIRRIHRGIGSGYPSDPETRAFLAGFKGEGSYPDFVRRSWKTLERIGEDAAALPA